MRILTGERVRARSDSGRRSAYGGTGLDEVQGPRRFDIWGKIGGAIKHGVQSLASVAANPLVEAGLSFIPGVGWVGAAGIGALSHLLEPGGNIGSAVTGGLEGAASGLAAGKVKDIIQGASSGGIPGALGALGSLPGGIASVAKALGVTDSSGGIDWAKAGLLGLSAAQMVNAGHLQDQANTYAKDALSGVQQNYADRQPLRQFGEQSMLQPKIADLSGFLTNSGPYAAGLPKPSVQAVQQYAGTVPTVH